MSWAQRVVPILIPLFMSIPAQAEMLGSFTASNNYLWRGVTQTNDNPAVSAALEYRNEQGGYFGAWTSNTEYGDNPSYEVDIFLGHLFAMKSVNLDLAARHYYYAEGSKYRYDFPGPVMDTDSGSFTEFQVGLSLNSGLSARYSYSGNYLDSDAPGDYIEFNYIQRLPVSLTLLLHIGVQEGDAIDDIPENRVSDYSATLRWKNLSLTASNMSDNTDGRQSDRARYVIGWREVLGN